MTATLCPTFTTAVRMVDRIHTGTANMRTAAKPTGSSGFAQHDRHMIPVTNLSNRRPTGGRNAANLATGQGDLRPIGLARHQRGIRTGAATHAATAPGQQLDAMNRGTKRDILERQRIPDRWRRGRAVEQLSPNLQSIGSQDISLFAVGIMEQGDAGTSIRIVFNGRLSPECRPWNGRNRSRGTVAYDHRRGAAT